MFRGKANYLKLVFKHVYSVDKDNEVRRRTIGTAQRRHLFFVPEYFRADGGFSTEHRLYFFFSTFFRCGRCDFFSSNRVYKVYKVGFLFEKKKKKVFFEGGGDIKLLNHAIQPP